MLNIHISIIRHGQTDCNARGVLQGQMETSLNSTGREEAEKLGARLKNQRFTHIYSSNLERAVDTARLVLGHNVATADEAKDSIVFDARLRERSFGDYEGKPKEELAARHAAAAQEKDYPGKRHFVPENGESTAEVYARAREFLIEICLAIGNEKKKADTVEDDDVSVLISTHGGVAIELFAFLVKELHCPPPSGKSASRMIAIPGNTALSTFRVTLNLEDVVRRELTEVVSRPAYLFADCACLTIHDRSHCENEAQNEVEKTG